MIPPDLEKISGYDFELVIGSKQKGKFIRLFIQSKRLIGNKVNSNYTNLKFDQTDRLIAYSKNESSLGIYAFYNHLTENDGTLLNHYNSCTPFNKKNLGITLTSAYSVKMQNTKSFTKYHFNNGLRVNPIFYSLRHFPDLFYYHNGSKDHLAIPFHELCYFTIDMAEKINELYKKIKAKKKNVNFFFFFPPGIESFFEDDNDLIPIIETDIEKLKLEFKVRTQNENKENDFYNPKALIIIDTVETDNEGSN